MKIYTKTGDKGKTALCDGKRVSKNSLRLHTYGDIDELSSSLGLAIALNKNRKIKNILEEVQKDLFLLASHAATCSPKSHDVLPKFPKSKITKLERTIDELSVKLPKIKRFLLPGGTKAAAAIHLSRTICRRAERTCVALSEKEDLFENVIPYLNRLSDLLFVLARYANKGKDKII